MSDGTAASDNFSCPVSQSVMADAIELSSVHVSRSLGQLAHHGVPLKKSNYVDILDDRNWRGIVGL